MSGLRPLQRRLAVEISQLGAVEEVQQSLELATVAGAGVELEGKSASFKSSSDSIQPSNSFSFLSCSVSHLSRFKRISLLAGSRRQFSNCFAEAFGYESHERKRDSDEPDAPLLGEGEISAGDVDVVIGGEEGDQANNGADDGFNQSLAVKRKPPPCTGGWRRIRTFRISIHPRQPKPTPPRPSLVHKHYSLQRPIRPR